jgi:hypothetical protein
MITSKAGERELHYPHTLVEADEVTLGLMFDRVIDKHGAVNTGTSTVTAVGGFTVVASAWSDGNKRLDVKLTAPANIQGEKIRAAKITVDFGDGSKFSYYLLVNLIDA